MFQGCTVTAVEALRPSTLAVTVALPAATPVTMPSAVTRAIAGSLLLHVSARPASTFPPASRTRATTRALSPSSNARAVVSSSMFAAAGGSMAPSAQAARAVTSANANRVAVDDRMSASARWMSDPSRSSYAESRMERSWVARCPGVSQRRTRTGQARLLRRQPGCNPIRGALDCPGHGSPRDSRQFDLRRGEAVLIRNVDRLRAPGAGVLARAALAAHPSRGARHLRGSLARGALSECRFSG